ncbi:TonB-dependent receptor (plasmid) [Asticcacaulis sp. DW145]|uniref:TonB-dependent receptor n=1 Tax=Asticcacaulis sp. DW145 TaxID=3095608 RepID=UPI00308DBBB2|nr:TonB-dependent receptor [Asticcacaulis sp. DW145]
MNRSYLRGLCSASVAIIAFATAAPTFVYAQTKTYEFNIQAQDLPSALLSFGRVTHEQMMYDGAAVQSFKSNGVKGVMSSEEALTRILAGTSFNARRNSSGVWEIKAGAPEVAAAASSAGEVVVTGTHIRNAQSASPITTIGRKEIEDSGYTSIGDVMSKLPQSFGGGQNPGMIGTTAKNGNYSNAASINLRGLGNDATLTLVNGHRLSSDNTFQAPDISGIPLSAIQRIEVVTDGASALYGSDAIAGVANIILRKDYSGIETSARIGAATQGGRKDETYGVLWGKSDADWHLLGNLEYSKQEPVTAKQRGFTSGVAPDTTLFWPQKRHSLFLSGGKRLTETLRADVDAIVSDREATSETKPFATSTPNSSYRYTPSYSVSASVESDLGATWKAGVSAVASQTRTSARSRQGATRSILGFSNWLRSLEVNADGRLMSLPTGDLKLAVGAGIREEGFRQAQPGASNYIRVERDVKYAFGELLAPLVQPSETRRGLHAFDVSLATRTEEYSDWGRTTNPRFGFRYLPLNDLTVRGTWGKSFKSPSFYQMYQSSEAIIFNASSFGLSGGGTVMVSSGGNRFLKPEKAKTWTIGTDYRPASVKSLSLSATYFNIDYTDRVVTPVSPLSAAFSNPLFAPFINRAPTLSDIAVREAYASALVNFSGGAYSPSNVKALVDTRLANATSQKAEGVDLSYRQSFDVLSGKIAPFVSGSWLKIKQKTIVTYPEVELTGTVANPSEFKGRAGFTFDRAGLSATTIINYVAGGIDTGMTPNTKIASWTTVDGNIAYRFQRQEGVLSGLAISLAASNLFDKDPPIALSPSKLYTGIYYDSTNANVLGRVVTVSLSKAW